MASRLRAGLSAGMVFQLIMRRAVELRMGLEHKEQLRELGGGSARTLLLPI